MPKSRMDELRNNSTLLRPEEKVLEKRLELLAQINGKQGLGSLLLLIRTERKELNSTGSIEGHGNMQQSGFHPEAATPRSRPAISFP